MKFLKQLSLFALLAILSLTACQKDEILETTTETPTVTPTEDHVNGLFGRSNANADGLDLGCISIDYPFELLLLDETTVEISSEDDFINSLDDPDNPPLDFVYPLNVTDEDGNGSTVNDVEELAEIFADCIPSTGWNDDFPEWFFPAWDISFENSCYALTYPITLLNLDSMDVVANDEDELTALLADGNIYSFAFPVDLEDEDGAIVSAEDPEELFDLLSECSNTGSGCGIGTFVCYEIGYPATLLLIDGTTVEVNDDDEFAEVLMAGEWAGFEYPLTLIDEDGNETVVNDNDELNEAILECDPALGGGGSGTGGGPVTELIFGCYQMSYPATVILIDGTNLEVNDDTELSELFLNGEFANFGYPLTLIDEDGEEVVINDEMELSEALEECDGFGGGGGTGGGDPIVNGDFFCYDLSYPFSVLEISTGTEVTFNNSLEWQTYITANPMGPEPFDFVYPFTLIDEDGNEVTVGDEEEMFEAIEDCW